MQVKVKKLNDEAKLPVYGSDGAACFDIYCLDTGIHTINPNSSYNFKTGLSFEIPEGHVMMVFSRSGHGFKHGIRLSNSTRSKGTTIACAILSDPSTTNDSKPSL